MTYMYVIVTQCVTMQTFWTASALASDSAAYERPTIACYRHSRVQRTSPNTSRSTTRAKQVRSWRH